ncbi:unnamed protein product [Eruca vesicaria subsp. sativa]|uniref:AT-hook motif nuclear-localized protein n=1 Tax=Eruca vesicaria subsp. sativa TaxID=29727 RepID=A0ABC8L0Z7_ERUVS|nr:unnamed protein product [Eruca vesicaria subsp. sativa]
MKSKLLWDGEWCINGLVTILVEMKTFLLGLVSHVLHRETIGEVYAVSNVGPFAIAVTNLLDLTRLFTLKKQLYALGGTCGVGFTPHVIEVKTGEGPRAICILSATGAVSTMMFRQANYPNGVVKYETRWSGCGWLCYWNACSWITSLT